jgi:hypothetical protein
VADLRAVLQDAIDTARRNDDDVRLSLETALEIAARLAPSSVGGVDLERWRSLIARVDAYAKRQGLPSADDEHHCTILLSDARSVVAALERAARIEAAARVVADVACDEVPPAEVCPGCDWCPLRAAFGEEGGR